jgi:16S rRNA (guanine966-N2)-methyltransferase
MTRIVAGFAGSLPLRVPRSGTRPTSDRVREAIFSSLEARGAVRGAKVLDLYAGSGALGLEAASRGAAAVTLVESSRGAADVCRANARSVLRAAPSGAAIPIEVVPQTVRSYLGRRGSETAPSDGPAAGDQRGFDLVFADPPYDLADSELGDVLGLLAPLLSAHALLVVERASSSPEPPLPAGIQVERRKAYGDTALWWLSAG